MWVNAKEKVGKIRGGFVWHSPLFPLSKEDFQKPNCP